MSASCYEIMMRLVTAAALVCLAGCPIESGGGIGSECEIEKDCTEGVCARDGFCTPASQVREVKVTWTVNGQPATAVTCAGKGDLEVAFRGFGGDHLGYAPVPCNLGQFVIVNLPRTYSEVEVGREGGFATSKSIPASNEVAFDLQL